MFAKTNVPQKVTANLNSNQRHELVISYPSYIYDIFMSLHDCQI